MSLFELRMSSVLEPGANVTESWSRWGLPDWLASRGRSLEDAKSFICLSFR